MILTKEQQEKIVQKYINENHNTDECSGFIDGINATIELINKLTIPDVVVSNKCKQCREPIADEFKPIPLTEEKFLKLGLEKRKENEWIYEYNITKYNVPDGKHIRVICWKSDAVWGITLCETIPMDNITPTVLKYVHELQDLIFALTGEELKYNK